MIQQLATETGAQPWVIASMLFFITVFAVAAFRIWRTTPAEAEGFARIPLADDIGAGAREEAHGDARTDNARSEEDASPSSPADLS